jgi:hypothetical protein
MNFKLKTSMVSEEREGGRERERERGEIEFLGIKYDR